MTDSMTCSKTVSCFYSWKKSVFEQIDWINYSLSCHHVLHQIL